MIRLAVIGLGKMGLSHLALARAHPLVDLVAVCDATGYMLDVLGKYTGLRGYKDYEAMLREVELDAVIIATPSALHARMVGAALDRGVHVFCEKPFCLDASDATALARLADSKGLVNQVGYHNRFVGAFREAKRLLDLGVVGRVSHVIAEAYGPVVLRPKGSTWRVQSSEGGGCLYDYAAHPINLVNWFVGEPAAARGSVLGRVFSRDTDDEVFSTLRFTGGATGQVSVSWSDESFRKMTTRITVWGSAGRLYVDRQELQLYLRDTVEPPDGYRTGWNVRYTTDLTQPVWFYIRGEEYSAQLDHFFQRIAGTSGYGAENTFADAAATDRTLAMIAADAALEGELPTMPAATDAPTAGARAAGRRLRNIFSGAR